MKGGYRELIVWQKAMNLVEIVYSLSDTFPKSEMYGLSSQMRRCAISIPSNIAEGSKRQTKADFRNFLAIALGSTAELETQTELSKRLKLGTEAQITKIELLADEVTKMLSTLILRTRD